MLRLIVIVEIINAVTGVVVNILALKDLLLFGIPTAYLNSLFFVVFFGGFLAIYLNNNKIKAEIKTGVLEQIKKDLGTMKAIEPQEGSLDNVTSQDRALIMSMAMDMLLRHGHMDIQGMLADRASGVPLNELMSKNCSTCETPTPRNQKSKDLVQ